MEGHRVSACWGPEKGGVWEGGDLVDVVGCYCWIEGLVWFRLTLLRHGMKVVTLWKGD
jgi:hypothetical protein